MLYLSPMERVGGLKRLLKVLEACTLPMGLRPSGMVGRGHHLLPMALPVLIPLVAAMLGQSGISAAVPTAEVAGGFGLAYKVGLDGSLSVSYWVATSKSSHVMRGVSRPSAWMSAS